MLFKNDHFKEWAGPFRILCRAFILCLCMAAVPHHVQAQQADTANKITIHILNVRVITHFKTDSGEYNKFIDSVAFLEGTDTLYCDSAYQNSITKNFEAFGNVKISQQDGTHGTSDYLKYTSAKKLAYMRGNVTLMDGNNNMKGEELTYDLGTKTGEYAKGGVLQSDSTRVRSNYGIYNVRTKDARFKGKVVITDPQYKIWSEDLGYNTETKVETFYAHSVITSDSGRSLLVTDRGTYDSKNVIAHFIGHSSIWNDGEYIEADSMHYNKLTGYGYAIGNVISIDTAHHSTLYCGFARYFRRQRILWAMIKPVMEQVNEKDTIYMRADTFYSAPMVKMKIDPANKIVKDSLKGADSIVANTALVTPVTDTVDKRKNKAGGHAKAAPKQDFVWVVPTYKFRMPALLEDTGKMTPLIQYQQPAAPLADGGKGKQKKTRVKTPKIKAVDTTAADTTAPMYFVGYNHALIFSDSLQGKCDSICYTRSDSTIKMIYNPIVWAHNSQITGDTILLYLDSNQLRKMYVPNNAFLVSRSGPAKAKLFDQVQGKTLTAYFVNNTITRMVVYPNAACIYYPTDEKKAYIGVDEATSTRMRIFFDDQKIKNIKFEQDVHQTMTPLEKADLPNMKLSRYKWLIDQRPKTKEELFQ